MTSRISEKRHRQTVSRLLAGGILMLALPGQGWSDSPCEACDNSARPTDTPFFSAHEEHTALSVHLDNDAFSRAGDEDYTAGLAVAFAGPNAAQHPFSLDNALSFTDRIAAVGGLFEHSNLLLHNCEVGLALFTPQNLDTRQPIEDDRPYSSLAYISNTRQYIDADRHGAWMSTLSFAVLGLPLADNLQNGVHDVIGSREARGWDNQISDGGELTAKYSLTRQTYLPLDPDWLQASTAVGASLGYITEAYAGFNIRAGKLNTPGWSFNVNLNNYGEKADVISPISGKRNEVYVMLGATARARGYNALLQGQFRDSPVTVASQDMRNLLFDTWLGVGCEFASGFRLSYILRHQSSEIRGGEGDRSFTYGSMLFSYDFR